MLKTNSDRTVPSPEAVVLATVLHLAGDKPALERFLDVTGLDLRSMRDGVADGSLEAGILHYLASEQALLLEVAAAMEVPPEMLSAAIERRARGPEHPDPPVTEGNARRASTSTRRVVRKG